MRPNVHISCGYKRYSNVRRNLSNCTSRFVWGLSGTPMTRSIDDLEVRQNHPS